MDLIFDNQVGALIVVDEWIVSRGRNKGNGSFMWLGVESKVGLFYGQCFVFMLGPR